MVARLAWRYAFSRKNRHRSTSIRIAVGLALSTFALNVVIAFMVGLQTQRFASIRTYLSYDAIVSNITGSADDVKKLLLTDGGIDHAYVFEELPAVLGKGTVAKAGKVRAFNTEDFSTLPYMIIAGNPEKGICLSSSLMRDLGLQLGDSVEAILLAKGHTATLVPVKCNCTVSAVYYTPLADFNGSYFLLSSTLLEQLAGKQTQQIAIRGTTDGIQELLGKQGTVEDWKQQNLSLYAAMKLEEWMMYLMLSIMSLIILINLHSSNRNLLDDKLGEMLMLRAMGCTKGNVMRIFVLQSFFVSLVGVVCGSVTSFFVLHWSDKLLFFADRLTGGTVPLLSLPLEIHFSLSMLFAVALPILGLATLGAVRPTVKELKKAPMEILADE
ncbi:MAG: FtsX-like permease family protein [Spirochaetia bacterium]|jgi:lipoprotein-releasing system permease protein|nr:FtsX-like permease family protein [Spirochaetia bacterium]